jgi:hypothetical protein
MYRLGIKNERVEIKIQDSCEIEVAFGFNSHSTWSLRIHGSDVFAG